MINFYSLINILSIKKIYISFILRIIKKDEYLKGLL